LDYPRYANCIRLALGAAHLIIVPAQIEHFALAGINLLYDTTQAVHALVGENGCRIAGALITDYHGRGNTSTQVSDKGTKLRNDLLASGIPIFTNLIHHHEGIENAHQPDQGKRTVPPPFTGRWMQGRNQGERDYKAFVEELFAYVNRNNRATKDDGSAT
jgi:cellulose biosynthesis protein BcsQ